MSTQTPMDPAIPDTAGSDRTSPLRWQTLPWLGGGLLALWSGQRWIRHSTLDTEPRLLWASCVILVGLGALGVWAAYNRTHEGTDERKHAETPGTAHWVVGILAGLAMILTLVVALAEMDTQAVAWLRLSALGCFLGAGGSWPRVWSQRHSGRWLRSLGIGLCLAGGTLVVRLLFAAPVVPDAEALSRLPTVLGDMYRGLGLPRAVLVPFVLSCLWPAGIWWACSQVARAPWALSAGILVVFSPLQIWQPLSATPWALAPFALLLVMVAGSQVIATARPESWFWLGLGLALLWVEASAWRVLILIWILVMALPMGFLILSRTPRPGRLQGLYTSLGLMAGLLLYPVGSGKITGLLLDGETAGNVLYPSRLLAFWFQPGTLELPHHLTYFLFANGLLVLLGFVVVLVRGHRMTVPAVGAVAWMVGLGYASQHPDLFLSLSHLTAMVPWLLTTVALAALWPPISQVVATVWGLRLSERGLVVGVICLFLWQLPGGMLGFNPLLAFRAQMMDQGMAAVPEVMPDATITGDYVGKTAPPWPASLVWHTAGTCDEGTPVMSRPIGVAIDLASRQVYVVGQEPGMLVALDLDQKGQVRMRWVGELYDPVEVAVMPDGSLRILDAGNPGIWSMDPGTENFVLLTEKIVTSRARGFHVLQDGQMLVAATSHDRIVRYGADGEWLEDVGEWPGAVNLEQPTDVLMIGDRLWTTVPHQFQLREIYSGVQLTVTAYSNTLAGPHMAALADGTFLLTDSGAGRILHMKESGHLQAVIEPNEPLDRPVDVDVVEDPEGIWMAVTDPSLCRVSLWWLDPEMAVQTAGDGEVP